MRIKVAFLLSAILAVGCSTITAAAAIGPAQTLNRFDSGLSVAYGRYLPFGGYNAIPMVRIGGRGRLWRIYLESQMRFASGHIDNSTAINHLRAYSIAQRIGWIFHPHGAFRIIPFARVALDLDSAGGLQTGAKTTGLAKTLFGSNPDDIKGGYELGGGIEVQIALGSRLVLAPYFDANHLRRAAEVIGTNGQVIQTRGNFTLLRYGAAADFRLIGPLDLYATVQSDRISGHGSALEYAGGVALRF